MIKRKYKYIKSKYKLLDGELLNKQHPDTFEIPDRADRVNLEIGRDVKLYFEEGDMPGERMYVKITKIIDTGEYEGELLSGPMFISLEPGDKVKFKAKHIIQIWEEK